MGILKVSWPFSLFLMSCHVTCQWYVGQLELLFLVGRSLLMFVVSIICLLFKCGWGDRGCQRCAGFPASVFKRCSLLAPSIVLLIASDTVILLWICDTVSSRLFFVPRCVA